MSLTSDDWDRVKELFQAALELEPPQRAAFLAENCHDDQIQKEVEKLLSDYQEAGSFLNEPVLYRLWEGRTTEGSLDSKDLCAPFTTASETEVIEPMTGRRLGAYKIVRRIGHGGMAAVFLATRADDEYQKQVAIKLVQPGLASLDLLSRFRNERQTLADLDHPNIVKLLDGGSTPEGSPFLVMDYVQGAPNDDYCDRHKLHVDDRLRLFSKVCEAVHYAHQKSIVHRDLKPSNILVTNDGTPKVLDFGIAKVLSPQTPAQTLTLTQTSTRCMTPAYASPEQMRGKPVTTATDIYSLGVVLYELLSGHRPYRLKENTPAEIERAICEQEPEAPSMAVSRVKAEMTGRKTPELVSETRKGPPEKLRRQLRGDLDNIVLKALQKEPARRYASVEEFSQDITRHLEHLPVKARRPTFTYRASKFIRRHKTEVGAGLLVALALTSLALFAFNLFRWSHIGSPAGSTWVKLTNFADSATSPALSSDGRMITFIRGPDTFVSPGQIYVKLLPDGQPAQLTHDNLPKMAPVFSPDGSRVAYTATDASFGWNIWVVPVLGGEPQKILLNTSALTWIDPQHVLFSEIKTGARMAIATAAESRAGEHDVYVPSAEDGMAHRSWLSPDGKWVLVSEMVDGGWRPCRVLPFDGRSVGEMVGPTKARCTYAGWAPDSQWMYFSADAGDGFHIWRQRFPKGVPEQMTFGPTEEEGIAVALDGRSLVTSAGIRQSSIWLHDGGGDRQISSEGFASLPGLGFNPSVRSAFSRDGKRLFYLVRQGSSPGFLSGELWVAEVDSGRTERVLPGVLMGDFEIAPDRERVAFASPNSQGSSRVWVAALDRRTPPQQLTSFEADHPSFGPNGDIFFRVREGSSDFVYRIERNGTEPRKVHSQSFPYFYGVSPNGEWLVGSTVEPPPCIRAVHPTRGGSPVRICDFCNIGWDPNGKFLYVRFRGVGDTGGGKTFVIGLPAGKELPALPDSGLKSAQDVKGLNVVAVIDMTGMSLFAPGPNPAMYAYARMTVQRNLFRIPLN
jgi:serine/threonine protein kinase